MSTKLTRCAKCVYPVTTRPLLHIDEEGVCSGCRVTETLKTIDWTAQERKLADIFAQAKAYALQHHLRWNCVIGVSGGKDSWYQVYVAKVLYGFNPLTVTFNHIFNSELGMRNLRRMVEVFGVDNLRLTMSPHAARKIARHMLLTIGDLTYAYHAGCLTVPMRMAAQYGIPLVVWGDQGFTLMHGMFQPGDMPEWTQWQILEHDMRGVDPHDLVGKGEPGWELDWKITEEDVAWFEFPTPAEIDAIDLRGIYLSNYLPWDAHEQAKLVHEQYGFELARSRQSTFLTYSKLDDWANDIHSYLKYLKFGYGRATDDVSTEIRAGRMDRKMGMEIVETLDPVRPQEWNVMMEWLGLRTKDVLERLGGMADGGREAVLERWARGVQPGRSLYTADTLGMRQEMSAYYPYWTELAGAGWGQNVQRWVTL